MCFVDAGWGSYRQQICKSLYLGPAYGCCMEGLEFNLRWQTEFKIVILKFAFK